MSECGIYLLNHILHEIMVASEIRPQGIETSISGSLHIRKTDSFTSDQGVANK